MPIIDGTGLGHPLSNAGAPTNGTDEVQTLTIGGTPEAGSKFRLNYDGFTTAYINWSSTNNTLRDNVDAALEALPNIGTGGMTTAVDTMTAGVGTLTLTFAAQNGKRAVNTITVVDFVKSDGTASAGTAAVVETTPGVNATGLNAPKGSLLSDTSNGILYINTGTAAAPTWTKVGTQT